MTTREELYLKRLNDSSVTTPPPVTQKEKILADLSGVGGLGIEFPAVTSADEGKVLTVADGQWALGNGGSSGGGNVGTGNFIIPFHTIYNPETQQVECTCETTWTEFINAYKSGLVIEFRNIMDIYNSEDTYYTPFRLSNVIPRNNLDTSVFYFTNLNSIYPSGWTWYKIQVEKDTNSTEDAISFEILTHQVTHQVNDNV